LGFGRRARTHLGSCVGPPRPSETSADPTTACYDFSGRFGRHWRPRLLPLQCLTESASSPEQISASDATKHSRKRNYFLFMPLPRSHRRPSFAIIAPAADLVIRPEAMDRSSFSETHHNARVGVGAVHGPAPAPPPATRWLSIHSRRRSSRTARPRQGERGQSRHAPLPLPFRITYGATPSVIEA
jgi:hypothetical protein